MRTVFPDKQDSIRPDLTDGGSLEEGVRQAPDLDNRRSVTSRGFQRLVKKSADKTVAGMAEAFKDGSGRSANFARSSGVRERAAANLSREVRIKD